MGARDLGGHEGISRLCYFLDGVQSSREIGRIGMSPVIVSTVAATRSSTAAGGGSRGCRWRARLWWCRP